MATAREVITRLTNVLRGGAGAASTVLGSFLASWLVTNYGLDIDEMWVTTGVAALLAPWVLRAEQQLNRLERARWFVKLIRFGSSLPVYEHQGAELRRLDRIAKANKQP